MQSRQPATYRLMESVCLGCPRTWKKLTERDRRASGVRSAMRAASQLPGRGPTDVDVDPVPAQ